ncbi:GTPase IMAP family member 8-like isoform X2 [Conger conger]|uniref:GTPase IMAP family member 8-like isoform X2 n=1 Tax=Conger conger TaxID=82655 RepID=UPI002A5AF7B0|nr:GTPase IMAP family member 8-like isoform X2 [Conger conger]
MSTTRQVRIMLMGQTAEGQRSAGNIILGKDAFPLSEMKKSERHDGLVAGRHLAVITTADLFTSNLSEEEHSQGVRRCLGLSAPGPHVFLWVQEKGSITPEDWEALRRFKKSFADGASRYSMVLFMHEDHKDYSSFGDSERPGDGALQDFIQDCGGRYHLHSERNHTQVTELLEKIQEIVDENGGSYFTGEILKWSDIAWKGLKSRKKEAFTKEGKGQQRKKNKKEEVDAREELGAECSRTVSKKTAKDLGIWKAQSKRAQSCNFKRDIRECMRMVLVGRTGVGKSATGNTILGGEAFTSKAQMYSVTKECQKVIGRVAGRSVAVIDTPGLFDTTLTTEDVQKEIMKCMGLASPGPHVFLLVLSVGRFTPEEREVLRLIKMTFGEKAEKYTMVLFNRGDDLGDQSIEEYIAKGHPEVKKLIKDCGGRHHVFNNKEKTDRNQVLDLFKKIEVMNWENGGSCYTLELFQEAEVAVMRIQMWKEKEEEMKRELEMLQVKKSEIEDLQRQKQESEGNLEELLAAKYKVGEQESPQKGGHHKRRNKQRNRLSPEDGEGENQKQDEDGNENVMGVTEEKGSKFLRGFNKSIKRLQKKGKRGKEMKKREENDGEETNDDVIKKAEKPTNEKLSAKSDDAESQDGEDRPYMKERQEVKKEKYGENAPVILTEAEYARLMNVIKQYEVTAKQQVEELKCFMMKYSDHFEALEKKQRCAIQ